MNKNKLCAVFFQFILTSSLNVNMLFAAAGAGGHDDEHNHHSVRSSARTPEDSKEAESSARISPEDALASLEEQIAEIRDRYYELDRINNLKLINHPNYLSDLQSGGDLLFPSRMCLTQKMELGGPDGDDYQLYHIGSVINNKCQRKELLVILLVNKFYKKFPGISGTLKAYLEQEDSEYVL